MRPFFNSVIGDTLFLFQTDSQVISLRLFDHRIRINYHLYKKPLRGARRYIVNCQEFYLTYPLVLPVDVSHPDRKDKKLEE